MDTDNDTGDMQFDLAEWQLAYEWEEYISMDD